MFTRLVDSRLLRTLRRHTGTARRQSRIAEAFKCDEINMGAMDRVTVAQKSGFLYNRVEKNANSTLITLVHWLEMGRTLEVMASRRNVPRLDDCRINQISDLSTLPRMVVVRNPYSRTLSAFLNKVDTPRFGANIGELEASKRAFIGFCATLKTEG